MAVGTGVAVGVGAGVAVGSGVTVAVGATVAVGVGVKASVGAVVAVVSGELVTVGEGLLVCWEQPAATILTKQIISAGRIRRCKICFCFFIKGISVSLVSIFLLYIMMSGNTIREIAKDLRCRQRELENGIITVVACITRLPCVSI